MLVNFATVLSRNCNAHRCKGAHACLNGPAGLARTLSLAPTVIPPFENTIETTEGRTDEREFLGESKKASVNLFSPGTAVLLHDMSVMMLGG